MKRPYVQTTTLRNFQSGVRLAKFDKADLGVKVIVFTWGPVLFVCPRHLEGWR